MRKIFLVLALALILISSTESFASSSKFGFLENSTQNQNSLRFFYVQNQSPADTASSKYASNKSLTLKDPKEALFYAIVPGFVVHGAGHFYAGETKTGIALLATELMSFGFYVVAVLEGLGKTESREDHSGAYAATAVVLFMGSWGFDIFRAPKMVMKQNQELQKKQGLNLKLEADTYCIKLQFIKTF
ncbi:MAG: hypothetical protein WBD28_01345 [Candidatus Zixiibacteriota bacterium]